MNSVILIRLLFQAMRHQCDYSNNIIIIKIITITIPQPLKNNSHQLCHRTIKSSKNHHFYWTTETIAASKINIMQWLTVNCLRSRSRLRRSKSLIARPFSASIGASVYTQLSRSCQGLRRLTSCARFRKLSYLKRTLRCKRLIYLCVTTSTW